MTTIKDIARVAGVSVTTVSRALNGYSDVNQKTKKRIEEVAKELNYSPNTVARSLVMKKSKTIGLLVSDMNREGVKDNFTFEVLCGINEASANSDYDLVLFSTTSTKQSQRHTPNFVGKGGWMGLFYKESRRMILICRK